MTYQLTLLASNSGAAFATSGSDGSLWSTAANSLYWHDGCAWQIFATFGGGVTGFAAQDLKNLWALKAFDFNRIYYFNGIAWSLRTLPSSGSASRLAIGFDGKMWCLDNAAQPKVWSFDAESGIWVQFAPNPPVDATFKEIASGGTVAGGPFLLAIDTAGKEWQWTTGQLAWQQIPGVTPGYGKSIAAGPDRTVFLVDTSQGQLWKWKAGEDSNWVLLDSKTGFVQVSARADGSLVAIHSSGEIYEGLKTYPSLKGFRGSDWNNAGTKIFAVRSEKGTDLKYRDHIYRSADGITFETSSCGTLPELQNDNPYFWYALPLFIPTAKFGDATEKMLISPINSETIYRCNDISQASLTFTPVLTDTVNAGTGGIFNGFAEDADRNVYAGWYSIYSSQNKAILYKSTRASDYGVWTVLKSWEARHIHTVRVNPYNGYLYVVLGEPRDSTTLASDSADTARIMRSKDGGTSWECVTDTWAMPVMPAAPGPIYLGLYFATLGFIKNRVVLGEDTDFKRGRIFYFDDDGRDGSDPGSPLPFVPQVSYTTCNNGEFFLGAVSLGDRLYFASQFLAPTTGVASTRCVSTADGSNWKVEQICAFTPSAAHASFGLFTHHPERRGRLIYSLSATDSFVIDET
ncbi:MAG TPA: hypothetical protein VFP12_16905 [Allosphingosinicella sp.]|nr:hypothetical protein [Allosphingosinicella sp.]